MSHYYYFSFSSITLNKKNNNPQDTRQDEMGLAVLFSLGDNYSQARTLDLNEST